MTASRTVLRTASRFGLIVLGARPQLSPSTEPMPPGYIPLLVDYNEGRRPVQDVLQACRSFQGPQPHFLCDYAVWCFGHLSEPKLFVLM